MKFNGNTMKCKENLYSFFS